MKTNGSSMDVLGTTHIDVHLSEQSMGMTFKIVKNLFFRVIIWIKTIIQIEPQDKPIAFISKVEDSESENQWAQVIWIKI